MNKKTIFEFCQEVIKNDDQLKKIADHPIMFVTLTLVASQCVEAYQKALMEGVEFEAAKASED